MMYAPAISLTPCSETLYIGKHPTPDRNTYLELKLNFSGISGELHNYRQGLDAHCQTMFDYFCDIYADYLPQGIKKKLDEKSGAVEQLEYLFTECNKTEQKIYLFLSMSMTTSPMPSSRMPKAFTDTLKRHTKRVTCAHSSTK